MSDKKATGFVQTGEPIPELDEVFGHTKNSLKKIHMPIDDPYIMGKIPQVKVQVNLCIDKVKLCTNSSAILRLESIKTYKYSFDKLLGKNIEFLYLIILFSRSKVK